MPKLLYVESSPRKDRAASITVAKEFLKAYTEAHPQDEITTLDLWAGQLPEFNGEVISAKYRILHGQAHTTQEAEAWRAVEQAFAQFNSADKYLFSLPMWNFGIPYKLKQFIDVITQPTLAFSFSPADGYKGLVTGRPAAVIYTRGGEYSSAPEAAAFDYQKPYFEMWLRFIGFTEIRSILLEPTLAGPDVVEKVMASGTELARQVAKNF